jgi:hypothetical protein
MGIASGPPGGGPIARAVMEGTPAVGHLRRMLAVGPKIQGIDGYCHYCRAYLISDEPHDEDCAFPAARAFVDSLSTSAPAPRGGDAAGAAGAPGAT